MSVSWCRQSADGALLLSLHIRPGAKRSAVVGEYGEALKVSLQAPPVDGKANAALRSMVAERLGVALSSVVLVSGETSRSKRLRVSGTSLSEVLLRLKPD